MQISTPCIKRDHAQKISSNQLLLTSLVKRWFDGKKVDFSVKIIIAFYSTFPHCVHIIRKCIDFTEEMEDREKPLEWTFVFVRSEDFIRKCNFDLAKVPNYDFPFSLFQLPNAHARLFVDKNKSSKFKKTALTIYFCEETKTWKYISKVTKKNC